MVPPRPLRATRASGIPIPRPHRVVTAGGAFMLVEAGIVVATAEGDSVLHLLLASLPAIAFLSELGREFGQIRTKLQSSRHHFEPQHLK